MDVCPYQGLAPFNIDGSELFFGRARAVQELLERLGPRVKEHGSILLVSGVSGVGKSSLLRAGLIPALAKGMLPVAGSRDWPRLLITPSSTPLRVLAEAWTETYGGHAETVHDRLQDDPLGAVSGLLAQGGPAPGGLAPGGLASGGLASGGPASGGLVPGGPALGGRFVVVVDQFEELFTLVSDEEQRQVFVRALDALANGPTAACVIIGLRADYWDRCAAYPQFAKAIQDGQVIVEPMAEPDLRLAITGPAAAVGLEIEPGLVDIVLAELRDGQAAAGRYRAGDLPLLSQALRNTWDRREDGRLTIRGYEESGGVRDSVRRTADEVLERLPQEDRKTAFRLFRRMTLITAGGRVERRRATPAELHAAASVHSAEQRARVEALLSEFAGRRLLTLHADTVEIAHDTLLTAWPALRQWLEPDLAAQQAYDQLIEDAAQWAENHRDPAFLYRGARLLTVQDSRSRWDRDPGSFPPPGPTVEGFVAASTRAARRAGRRRRFVQASLAVLSALALLAAGLAFNAARNAEQQRRLAVSRQLAAQSEVVSDRVISALLAVAAWRIAPTNEARHRMLATAARPGRGQLTGHTSPVVTLAFAPGGRMIATGSTDGTARLWDTVSRRQLGAPIVHPPGGCTATGVKVAFSSDGRTLASGCSRTVWFWDASTHRQLGAPVDAGSVVSAIAFGPDRRTLAVGSFNGTVRLWDAATRRPHGKVMGRASGFVPVNSVAFSSDGRRMATAGPGSTARLWDVATQAQVGAALTGHTGTVSDVSFSPDEKMLATASEDGTTRFWDLTAHRQAGAPLKNLVDGSPSRFQGVAFSPDGKRLATAGSDGATRLWDTSSRAEVGAGMADNGLVVRRVAFSPNGRLLAAAGDDGVVRLADPATHRQIGPAMPALSAIALSPDGRTLAAGEPDGPRPAVQLWDVTTQRRIGGPLKPWDGPVSRTGSVAHVIEFGPGGRTLATVGFGGVRLWDATRRSQLGPAAYPARRSGVVAFSRDGGFFAVQRDDYVLFWDIEHRRELGPRLRVPDHTEFVSAMAISPDDSTLAIAGSDQRVRVFDIATRRQLGAPLPIATLGLYNDLAFSPDGRTLAITASDETVRFWDVAARRPVGTALTGHTSGITVLAFSPDGKILATGSADETVRLWDLLTYRQIAVPLTGHTGTVAGIAYSSDGTTIATVSDDETARLWNVAPAADLVATACANAGRSLTPAEWKTYVPQEEFRPICR